MTDLKANISFEYDYIRVVYELILTNLRSNKKIIEKEISIIVTKLSIIKKKNNNLIISITQNNISNNNNNNNNNTTTNNNLLQLQEFHNTIKTLHNNITKLESKFDEITKEENIIYNSLQERIKSLELIDNTNTSSTSIHINTTNNLKTYCEQKTNHLLLEFFLREKFLETAKCLIKEQNIDNSVEFTIYSEIEKIILNLKSKLLNSAIQWCVVNKSKLSKINSNIKFKLLKQQFLEIYKEGNFVEAVKFARENLTNELDYNSNNNSDQLEDIKEIALLLSIKRSKYTKLSYKEQELLSEDKWVELELDFKQTFFQVYSMKESSSLEVLFQSGVMSLKTIFCNDKSSQKNIESCPICNKEICTYSKELCYNQHPNSYLTCTKSKIKLDENNLPMVSNDGYLYSENVVKKEMEEKGYFECKESNKSYYNIDELKKVYIV